MNARPRRIFGIETEYGVMCASTDGGPQPMDAEEAAQRIFNSVIRRTGSTNIFLANGARLYLDVGAHPEYATAECDELTDLIANDRAGDAIFADLVSQANEELAKAGIAGKIHMFKNNLDSYGNSYGCHENYLVRRRRDFRARIDSLIPFFVSRQVLVGAGHINEAGGFEFSQRADKVDDAVSAATTRSRPMINTRDEPHGDAELYRRLHVIVGDSNVSDTTNALKVAMTEAVLNALEEGLRLPDFKLANPVVAIRQISADLSGRAEVELENGNGATALQIQRALFDATMNWYDEHGWFTGLDPVRTYAFDLWRRGLEGLEAGDTAGLAGELDWVTKKALLERYSARLGVGLDDPRIARLDLAWHDITDEGLRPRLEQGGQLRRIVGPEVIEQAKDIPPQTTRAKLRGDFVAAARSQRLDYMADWMNLRLLGDGGASQVLLKDPFVSEDPAVDQLLETIDQMAH